MAATLLSADRSSARTAAVSSPPADDDCGDATALTEAVFHSIADGKARVPEEIGRSLGGPVVDDSAIREEVARLRRYGMPIDEVDGTVIAAPCSPLDPVALTRALPSWQVEVVFATRSTNSDLLAAVRAQLPVAPVMRAAELQFAGRGRLGRRWSSAPGTSLTASFALTVRRRLSQLDGATLVCGLAVHAVLADFGVQPRLKWPNDVLVDGGKVAGILVEAQAAGDSSILVIGIGVNVAGRVAHDDRSYGHGALRRTTLEAAGANDVDRNLLAARLAASLAAHMSAFEEAGFGRFAARWNAVDAFGDRSVTLEAGPGSRKAGIARGVDDRGALLVDIDGKRQRIVTGDVSLRPADEASP